jgi:hypothetical protein
MTILSLYLVELQSPGLGCGSHSVKTPQAEQIPYFGLQTQEFDLAFTIR